MFEGIVAYLLNKYIGKYVKDFDAENLNIGIFSGTVQLTDLQLKPEALYELDLPIEVIEGCIKKISIDIPWTTLYSDPILVHLEDVLILASPITDRAYDADLEKRLIRAKKHKIIEDVKQNKPIGTLLDSVAKESKGFFENLVQTVVNNVQISIQNVHLRYEDRITRGDGYAICAGLAFQSLTAITTNNKWKPTQIDSNSTNIFKLVKLETLYLYWNPKTKPEKVIKNDVGTVRWASMMRASVFNCNLKGEEFDFVLKPLIAKLKLIYNKSKELRVPKLLVDCVLQDASIELSQLQYATMILVADNFKRLEVNRRYRKYYNGAIGINSKARWLFAFTAVREDFVRPYSWERVKRHRENYRNYRDLYKEHLMRPNDAEVKVDLQIAEDNLDVTSLIVAQEEAKLIIANEDPNYVETIYDQVDAKYGGFGSGWKFWLGLGLKAEESQPVGLLRIKSEKENLWSKLTLEEQERLRETLSSFGKSSQDSFNNPENDKYIAHKINFTLANITISLLKSDESHEKEIFVASLNQFLASIETRPSVRGYKVSVRTETLIVEGLAEGSSNYELIPIVSAEKSLTTTNSESSHKMYVFGIDFEKKPQNVTAEYSITGRIEPVEVLYQHQSVSEITQFFLGAPSVFYHSDNVRGMVRVASQALAQGSKVGKKSLYKCIIEKQPTLYFNLDIKSPYVVIPESGALERCGKTLVVDFGRVLLKSDLQPLDPPMPLERDVTTACELEEKLYDRINLTVSDVQVLFSDTNDEWRSAKDVPESEVHILTRLHVHCVFSRCLRPDFETAPEFKLNVAVAGIKLNLSDRRIRLLCGFILKIPVPRINEDRLLDSVDTGQVAKHGHLAIFEIDNNSIQREMEVQDLKRVRYTLSAIPMDQFLKKGALSMQSSVDAVMGTGSQTINNDNEQYYSASDISDLDDSEIVSWVRTKNVPGFDENLSPSNTLKFILRFTVGEIVVHLARSSDVSDKPYLMLRAEKLNLDLSVTTFGLIVQASLRKLQLVDKQSSSLTGGYLELISSPSDTELISLFYRKVKASCPDFKSHFHQIEHSLTIDLSSFAFTFHRESIITMWRYISYVVDSIPSQFTQQIKVKAMSITPESPTSLIILRKASDPPVPSGATKLSVSVRVGEIVVHLCETEADFAKVEIKRFKADFIQKANERYVVRADLSELNVYDATEDSLYSKIFYLEGEDKLFDLKYVNKSPYEAQLNEEKMERHKTPCQCDGSFRLRVGRLHFVLLFKFLADAYHFVSPFIEQYQYNKLNLKAVAARSVEEGWTKVAERGSRIQFDIKIKGPSILLPQKIKSPNVIVCNFGELTLENFLSEVKADSNRSQTMDNLLVRLVGFELYRGTVQITENDVTFMQKQSDEMILTPLNLQVDIKQALHPRFQNVNIVPLDISASVESICANISQADLAVFAAIYQENFEEGLRKFITSRQNSAQLSPNVASPSHGHQSDLLKGGDGSEALATFLAQMPDVSVEKSFRLSLEGVEVTLLTKFNVKNTASAPTAMSPLCKVELNDITVALTKYFDQSLEMKLSLQTGMVDDMRKETLSYARKVFQPHNPCAHPSVDPRFSICAPPMFDLTYKKTRDGGHVDVMVERTRFNISVSFLVAFHQFLATALSPNTEDVADISLNKLTIVDQRKIDNKKRLPSDITSGFHSNFAEESTEKDNPGSFSLSAVFKKVEVLLYCDPCELNTRLIILRFDSIYDYSRNDGIEQTVLSFVGMEIVSCVNGKRSETASMILYPTDIEASIKRSLQNTDAYVRISDVDARFSAAVIQTLLGLVAEIKAYLKPSQDMLRPDDSTSVATLWQPKKIYSDKWLNYIALRHLLADTGIPAPKSDTLKEAFTLHPFDVKVYFELNRGTKVVPILRVKLTADACLKNWSHEMEMKSNLLVESMNFNQNLSVWEPFLEPHMEEENKYKPVEVVITCVRDVSYPITCRHPLLEERSVPAADVADSTAADNSQDGSDSKAISLDEVSSEESDADSETLIVKVKNTSKSAASLVKSSSRQESLKSVAACVESSDSETEDGVFGKLATAFSHLISDHSSDDERAEDFSDASDVQPSEFEVVEHSQLSSVEGTDSDDRVVKASSGDVTDQTKQHDRSFTNYCLLTIKDKLNFTVTPDLIANLHEFTYSLCGRSGQDSNDSRTPDEDTSKRITLLNTEVTIQNFLGPEGVVRLLAKEEDATDLKYKRILELSGRDACPSKAPAGTEVDGLTRSKSSSKDILINLNADEETEENSHLFDIDHTDSCFKTKGTDPDCISLDGFTVNTHYYEAHLSGLYEASTKHRLSIEIAGFEKIQLPLPQRTIKAVYPLKQEKGIDHGVQSRIRYFVAVTADVSYGLKSISVASPLLVENHLGRPVLIMCLKDSLQRIGAAVDDYARNPFHERYVQLASLEDGCKFNVPLLVAYHCQLFLQPITLTADEPSFELSSEGLWWQEIVTSVSSGSTRRCKFVKCSSAQEFCPDFWIKVVPKHNKEIKAPTAGMKTIPNLTLLLYPPAVIHNSLCYSISLISKKSSPERSIPAAESNIFFSEGESVSFFNINPKEPHEFVVEVPNYIGCQWRGKLCIVGDLEDDHKKLSMSRFVSEGAAISKDEFNKMKYRQLTLGVHYKTLNEGAMHVYLYNGYWIVNKTGISCLQVRSVGSEIVYDLPGESEPLLFNFLKRKQKKIKIRVNRTNWSRAFSLDTAGNQGVISIHDKERNKKYRFIVDIKLSELCPLTKIVLLKPYFLVSNSTDFCLAYMEESEEKDLWIDLEPYQCTAYYPDTKSMRLSIKQKDSKIASHHFRIDIEHTAVLRMDLCQALTVEVTKSEKDSTVINIRKYSKSDIPARIENYCEDVFIKINQKLMGQTTLLSPFQSIFYTWDDPAEERILMWNVYNRKGAGFRAQIERDGYGQELVSFQSIKQFSVPNRRHPARRKNVLSHRVNATRRKSVPPERYSSESDDSDDSDNFPKKKLRKDRVAIFWVSYIDPDDHQRVLLFTQDERIAKEARKGAVGQLSKWEQFVSFHDGLGLSIISNKQEELAYVNILAQPATWEIEISHKWKPLTAELSAWLEDQFKHQAVTAQLKGYLEVDLTRNKMHVTKPFYGKLRRSCFPPLWAHVRMSKNYTLVNLKIQRLQIDNQLSDALFPVVLFPTTPTKLGVSKPQVELTAFLYRESSATKRSSRNQLYIVKYLKTLIQELNVNLDSGFLIACNDFYLCSMASRSETDEASAVCRDMAWINNSVDCLRLVSKHKQLIVEYLHLSPLRINLNCTLRRSGSSGTANGDSGLLDTLFERLGATVTDLTDVTLNFIVFEMINQTTGPWELLRKIRTHLCLQAVRQFYVFILGLDILGNSFGILKGISHALSNYFYEPAIGTIPSPDRHSANLSKEVLRILSYVGDSEQGIQLDNVALCFPFDIFPKKKKASILRPTPTVPELLTKNSAGLVSGIVLGTSGLFSKPPCGPLEDSVENFFKGSGKGFFGLIKKPGANVYDSVAFALDGIRRLMETEKIVAVRSRLPRAVNPIIGMTPFSPYQARGYRILRSLKKNGEIYWCHATLSSSDRCDIALVTMSSIYLLTNCRFWGNYDIEWILKIEDLMSIPTVVGKSLIVKVGQYPDAVIDYQIDGENVLLLKWLKDKIEELIVLRMSDKLCITVV